MNRIRAIGRRIALLSGLAVALLAVGVVPAFASQAPPLNAGFGSTPGSGGTPGWQIALIIVGAVVAAVVVATVLIHRVRAARRPVTTPRRVAVPGK